MCFGYCNLSVIPGRSEPSDKAEMINQVLFGEHFDLVEENEKWYRIKLDHDGYECWVDKNQVRLLSEKNKQEEEAEYLVDEVSFALEDLETSNDVIVVLGSLLPSVINSRFSIGEDEYRYEGRTVNFDEAFIDQIPNYAFLYLNTPYLWGGRTPFGIDCSGFTQMVYRMCGFALPRDSHKQADEGELIDLVEEAIEGDLAFFTSKNAKISHVGIILSGDQPGKKQIVHASGKVRIDDFDEQGIFIREKQEYSHNLVRIKRIKLER